MKKHSKKLSIVCGPTASGKSDYAIEKFENHIIINADSMQLYNDLRILTAFPDVSSFAQCHPCPEDEIPHHLYGILSPHQMLNANDYAKRVDEIINKTEKNIVIVGGTGFYIEALLFGLDPMPEIPAQIKAEVEKWNIEKAYHSDPMIAQKLHINDKQRVKRAAAFFLAHGKSIFEFHSKRQPIQHCHPESKTKDLEILRSAQNDNQAAHDRFEIHLLMPEREELKKRIIQRCEKMFEQGVVDEVNDLYKKNKNLSELPIARVIGVCEILDYINGYATLEATKELVIKKTNQYAKRQCTWFRRYVVLGLVPRIQTQCTKR